MTVSVLFYQNDTLKNTNTYAFVLTLTYSRNSFDMKMSILSEKYIFLMTCNGKNIWKLFKVRINESGLGEYDAFFIFHDTVFRTYPENHNTKEDFYFLNQGTKTKFFLAVKVKNNFNMMRISFLLKQLCCCCLDIRFFSVILIGVSFCNSFQLYVLFLSVHWYTEDCFTITEHCFKSVYY